MVTFERLGMVGS